VGWKKEKKGGRDSREGKERGIEERR